MTGATGQRGANGENLFNQTNNLIYPYPVVDRSIALGSTIGGGQSSTATNSALIFLNGVTGSASISSQFTIRGLTALINTTNMIPLTLGDTNTGNIFLQPKGSAATGLVQIGAGGAGSATPDLLVLDNKNTAGDPTGTNGAMYYNSNTNRFRCFENGAWKNCTNNGSPTNYVFAYDTTVQTLATKGTFQTVTFNTTPQLNGWTYSAGNFTAPTTGLYLVSAIMTVINNTADLTFAGQLRATFNGTEVAGSNVTQALRDPGSHLSNVESSFLVSATSGQNLAIQFTANCAASAGCTAAAASGITIRPNPTAGPTGAGTPVSASVTIQQVAAAGADLAEVYSTQDASITMGDVVSLDPSLSTGVQKSARAYDPNVMGVISTNPAMVIGGSSDLGGVKEVPVALSGRVPVVVSAENGAIMAGDPLTTSSTPGVAMKATHAGPTIGMAMTGFDGQGTGTVMMFVKSGLSFESAPAGNQPTSLATGSAVLSAEHSATASAQPAGPSLLQELILMGTAQFHDIVTFFGHVFFREPPTFTTDTGGFAVIPSSATSVTVPFTAPYNSPPIITITLTSVSATDSAFLADVHASVTEVTAGSFTIVTTQPVPKDLMFTWIAVGVDNPRTVRGNSPLDIPAVTQTPSPIATDSGTLTPTETVTPEASPGATI
jgi:hypothetical protein